MGRWRFREGVVLPSVTQQAGQAAHVAKINIIAFFVLSVHWLSVAWGQVWEVG